MDNKNIRNGENFFLGTFVYGVIIFFAKWLMNIFSKIAISFAPAKNISELKETPGFLFNVTYPFLALIISIFYLLLLFGAFYFAAYKFAYKYDSIQQKKNINLQMILLFVFFSVVSLYNSIVEGSISTVYWYSGAFWGGLFGVVNKFDAIGMISTYDFSSIAYIIYGITPQIGVFIILSEVFLSVASFFVAFFARDFGAKKGIKERLVLREVLYKNSPNNQF